MRVLVVEPFTGISGDMFVVAAARLAGCEEEVAKVRMPTTVGELPGEWTTPTGALILGELDLRFDIPTIVTTASAFGAGA